MSPQYKRYKRSFAEFRETSLLINIRRLSTLVLENSAKLFKKAQVLHGKSSVRPILLVVLSIVSQCLIWMSARRYDLHIAREHGPMENFQAVCIFLGLVLLILSTRKCQLPGPKVFFAGMALLYFNFLMREIEFRKFTPKPFVIFLKGGIRDLWLG